MRIYLDDVRPAPEGWRLVRWPEEAIELLATGHVSEISLDHDLGDDSHGTGYDVVVWIEKAVATSGFNPPVIRVHSANISARQRMELGILAIARICETRVAGRTASDGREGVGVTSELQEAWLDAWEFAAQRHNKQRVPGSDLPYLKHLGMVGMEVLVAHAMLPLEDPCLAIRCALLHDTIEDQGVTSAGLEERFGRALADGVAALSKDPRLGKSEAMSDSLVRIQAQPKAVWCVKLADRISNLAPPPAYWSADKIAFYRAEARLILSVLGSAHVVLAQRLAEKIEGYPGS